MTLRRTAFLRATPDAATLTVKVPRPKKCKVCPERFRPWTPMQVVCGPACAHKLAKQMRAKADRESDRARKEALKSRGDWLAEVQTVFNEFIRLRDKDQPCICCGKYFDDKENFPGGQWDAGHYLARGSAPHLRFVENNVHKQLKGHNRPNGCKRATFRKGMIRRIGLEAVEALECDQASRDYTIPDLKAMKAEYAAKVKQLKART